ncbi:MAG: hypothetical protein M1833_000650 [Piccolia ochrophora]|nr:MAG: hypothetical protein M1833_000650 [Piccolia ochrophora]
MTNKKVVLVIGASRGIGRQVALDLARAEYAVVVAAKSTSDAAQTSPFPPNPNSPQSTINTVQREIGEAGGDAVAIRVDTRSAESVQSLFDETIKAYGRLDALVYNSGAIWWASVEETSVKRFRLMQQINAEGLYVAVQAALPLFRRNEWKGRIIVVSPPIYSRFFRGKTAYAMGKVSMSVLTQGLAMDFAREGKRDMAITSIWPATQFSAKDPSHAKDLRKPSIFSDAVLAILRAPVALVNGSLELDEDLLRNHSGITDFSGYSVVAGSNPRRMMPKTLPNLSVPEQDDQGMSIDSTSGRHAPRNKL